MVTIKLQRKWGASSMKQHAGPCSSMQQQRQQHQAALGKQHAAAVGRFCVRQELGREARPLDR